MGAARVVEIDSVADEHFERWDIVGHQLNRHLASGELSGTPAAVADFITFPPGFIHRMHRHPHADQLLLPLAGSVRFHSPDAPPQTVSPGRLLVIPRDNWHEVRNESNLDCQVFHLFAGVDSVADIGYEGYEGEAPA